MIEVGDIILTSKTTSAVDSDNVHIGFVKSLDTSAGNPGKLVVNAIFDNHKDGIWCGHTDRGFNGDSKYADIHAKPAEVLAALKYYRARHAK